MSKLGDTLRVVKQEKTVTLWVHPEGKVVGILFLGPRDTADAVESPYEVMNTNQSFLVLRRSHPDEIRFYNRHSIVRVEYEETPPATGKDKPPMQCTMHMMDGSVIEGKIHEHLPPERGRLYDYLNQNQNRFLKVFISDAEVCLVNKNYIIQVTTLTD